MSISEAFLVESCRGCGASALATVVDLGPQSACDHFPPAVSPGEQIDDLRWPLAVVVCQVCGLAQLSHDSPAPEEPLAVESATLTRHAVDVSARLVQRLRLTPGTRVLEYASSHGGNWQNGLAAEGMLPRLYDEEAPVGAEQFEVVLDNMSIIHAEDLQPQLATRVAQLAPGGRLVIEFHHAAAMVEEGQFDAVRHGHPLYFTLSAWRRALAPHGLEIETAWSEDVFGGCLVVVAAAGATPDAEAQAILAAEQEAGIHTPTGWAPLAERAASVGGGLRTFLREQRAAGVRTAAYGAGSKAVTFLGVAGVDADLLPVVGDLSPAKRGHRIPGTAIPIITPDELVERGPELVVILTWDIAREVVSDLRRRGMTGARYVVAQPSLKDVG